MSVLSTFSEIIVLMNKQGACITSVRGTTGIVDCYDPDNPSGTTQSCLDHAATSTCNPTDRCYTCEVATPYCHWETWIDRPSNSPTLRWFGCTETKISDATFYATDITTPSQTSHPTATSSKTPNAGGGGSSSTLSTGAIIGIAVGGGIAVVVCAAILAYCCFFKNRRAKNAPPPTVPQELSGTDAQNKTPQMTYQPPYQPAPPVELDSQYLNRDPSELGSTTAYSPHSQLSMPFTPPEGYAQNVEQVDMWHRGMEASKLENQRRPSYIERPAQPVYADAQSPRDSWGRGDDAGHMSPPRTK
ncbi:hypothetical protein BCR34DRAFT_596057 [Clohesyomyces aquaticus]|uniref:Mid2 domain-containing protein n=1 Tax=Clohesyomyces aquaticus TaxID=1231657 RepID=A0A1Y2A8I4_9PLEO|nr:hypothetical protein BCR34DRAFT_596057 [Clohesyomyces aquaticus]